MKKWFHKIRCALIEWLIPEGHFFWGMKMLFTNHLILTQRKNIHLQL